MSEPDALARKRWFFVFSLWLFTLFMGAQVLLLFYYALTGQTTPYDGSTHGDGGFLVLLPGMQGNFTARPWSVDWWFLLGGTLIFLAMPVIVLQILRQAARKAGPEGIVERRRDAERASRFTQEQNHWHRVRFEAALQRSLRVSKALMFGGIGLGLALAGGLAATNATDGLYFGTAACIALSSLFAGMVYGFYRPRCPACGARIGQMQAAAHCPKCGAGLHEPAQEQITGQDAQD